jgi:hypothetical protein
MELRRHATISLTRFEGKWVRRKRQRQGQGQRQTDRERDRDRDQDRDRQTETETETGTGTETDRETEGVPERSESPRRRCHAGQRTLQREREREFFIDNLLVSVHHID